MLSGEVVALRVPAAPPRRPLCDWVETTARAASARRSSALARRDDAPRPPSWHRRLAQQSAVARLGDLALQRPDARPCSTTRASRSRRRSSVELVEHHRAPSATAACTCAPAPAGRTASSARSSTMASFATTAAVTRYADGAADRSTTCRTTERLQRPPLRDARRRLQRHRADRQPRRARWAAQRQHAQPARVRRAATSTSCSRRRAHARRRDRAPARRAADAPRRAARRAHRPARTARCCSTACATRSRARRATAAASRCSSSTSTT